MCYKRFFLFLTILTFVVIQSCSRHGSFISISIKALSPSVLVGNTQKLYITGLYSDGTTADITSNVTWLSETTNVATIDNSGLVTGVSVGTSNIRARVGLLYSTVVLTVIEVPVTNYNYYVGGGFTYYGHMYPRRLMQLNSNGTGSKVFNNLGSGFNSDVQSISIQNDGKILVGGWFSSYNDGSDHSIGDIARLNIDGTLDATFSLGTGFDSGVLAMATQNNGKILVGGDFTSYNDGSDHSVGDIARLNIDGTLDATFSPGTGFNNSVSSLAIQGDGKILVGGYFSSYNDGSDHSVGRIVRLNTDGTLDVTFSLGTGFNHDVLSLRMQGDGKILVGGWFTSYNDGSGHDVGYIARLNTDGTLDATFSLGTGFNSFVNSLAIQGDGKILVCGEFTSYNDGSGHDVGYIARLNTDGTLDATFSPGSGLDNGGFSLATQSDGKVLVGGWFTSYNDDSGYDVGYIAKLTTEGLFNATFSPGTGFNSNGVASMVIHDEKILVGGHFTSYNDGSDHSVGCIARLNIDGTLDATFSPGSGFNNTVSGMLVLNDKKILMAGSFTSYNDGSDHSVGYIARLNTNGTFDAEFSPGTGFNNGVYSLAIQSDGKVLMGGDFSSYNDGSDYSVGGITRLNTDGTLDSTFSPGTGLNNAVHAMAVQGDGKVLIGGSFTSYNDGSDHSVGYIARLNTDGTLDSTFSPGTGFDNSIYSLAIQSDGKVLMGGYFTSYNDGSDHSVGGIARLNTDGTLDSTFSPGTGFDHIVNSLLIQSDNKILVAGQFMSYNDGSDHSVGRMVRLNPNGIFDNTFSPKLFFNSTVRAILLK